MSDLVERYVHQVGLYLPQKERADIEAELRSQIQDQLDERYMDTPSEDEVAAVLAELGHPYMMATSYREEQYLIGPDLYPFVMMILRRGWVLIPILVIFLNIFGAITSTQPVQVTELVLGMAWSVIQAVFVFSGIVVLIFVYLERSKVMNDETAVFKPTELPEVDDPRAVERFGTMVGMVFAMLVILLYLYFLRVGGLTLRFDLSNPGDVIPVPTSWLYVLLADGIGIVVLHLLILRRNYWTFWPLFIETVLELIGVIGLYFVVYQPVAERIITSNPDLTNLLSSAPEVLVVLSALMTLGNEVGKLVRLWNYDAGKTPTLPVQAAQ